ncbi:hypothetical protein KA005_47360, partial [bacterium]|nr:hypothetical protein [bacterium]
DSNRRITDFSKMTTRIDLLEKKVDRLREGGAEIRKDIDHLERRGGSDDEKIMVVDLNKEKDMLEEF